jgi:membrane protein required for colicin V production
MNWFDIVLLLILASSVVMSFRKGLSREVIGLASVFVALMLGIWFYAMAGAYLLPYVSSRTAANFAGFFLVFCAVALLGSFVSYIVGKFLKVTGLGFLDHALGAGFGMVRGTLIAVALVTGIMAFSPTEQPPDAVVRSRLAPYVVDAANVFTAMAPHELKEGFRRTYTQVKTAWGKATGKGNQKKNDERKI